MKLLIAVDAPGPAEFIAPVIPLLKQQFEVSILTIRESPTALLRSFGPTRRDSEAEAVAFYKSIAPDVLLTATSSLQLGPYALRAINQAAHTDGKKIICFQDYWANHRWSQNRDLLPVWDAMLAPDELAQQLLREDGYAGPITITGNPSFERFKAVDVAGERTRLRTQFGIPLDAFIVLYCGTATPQSWKEDETTFQFLANGMRSLRATHPDTYLLAHAHPRDEQPGRYYALAPDLISEEEPAVKQQFIETLLPIADVAVAMYSTSLIHACYLRLPSISILLPDAGMARLNAINLEDFPPTKVGATLGVYKPDAEALTAVLKKFATDQNFRNSLRSAQEQYFPFSAESAAERVASAVRAYAN